MSAPTDEQLMTSVQDGDIAAFEELVERYKRVVFSLSLSMLRSREDAEEAAQDTFVKLFRARDQFDPERRLEPWLLRIAGNCCRDALRRRRSDRLPTAGDDQLMLKSLVDPKSIGREWTEATRQLVRHEISQLSERLRQPLTLKYVNGLTNQQIGEALGISVSNVKVRVARAKDVLQNRLRALTGGAG